MTPQVHPISIVEIEVSPMSYEEETKKGEAVLPFSLLEPETDMFFSPRCRSRIGCSCSCLLVGRDIVIRLAPILKNTLVHWAMA